MKTQSLDFCLIKPGNTEFTEISSKLSAFEFVAMNDGIAEVRECMEGGSDAERKPLLPPCRICRGKASGFHYGVNSCEACKGFFRRCLRTKNELKCAADNDCTFRRGSRTNCSACRFRLCEQQGMSKQAIKTGRYTSARRSQYIKEVKLEAHTPGSTGINEEENSPSTADPIRNALECQDVPRVLHYDSLVSDLLQAVSRTIEGDLDSFLNKLKMESRKNDYFIASWSIGC
ncbi:nuclear receptor subfamily 1 group I member 2-like [Mya arenaria]|uniref:nuclear receptor subfamily 1 group I member 2-like n=1 Tax=Mya arenaria TaxID=6604 RepID=UPI0022E37AEC|nr:nuclear receptor subfamily 1 group I member 2-like [Mya arenaria]XP_052801308.1 nuclear receptor subfamily 1 group I member 2-like [Mya arenaria]